MKAKNRTGNTYNGLQLLFVLLVILLFSWLGLQLANNRRPAIGGTALVVEQSSGLVFEALVDTGAGRCSLNCLEIEIENEAELPEQNLGRDARLLIANAQGQQAWIEARLVDYSKIRNVDSSQPRYHVRLTLSAAGVTRKVTVTLKDRSHMVYPMLLGRNFLRDEFVVDVSKDSADVPTRQQTSLSIPQ